MTGHPLHKAKTKRPSPRHALRLGGFLRVFTSQPIRMRAPRSNINDNLNDNLKHQRQPRDYAKVTCENVVMR